MTAYNEGSAYRKAVLGDLASRATAALPATATGSLFTVAGGKVAITSIIGTVTTNIQAQACAVKLVATPTTGAVNDLSGTVDINGLAAGGLLSATGLAADALVKSTGGGISGLRNPIIVNVGALGLNTAATNTGSVKWDVTWVAVDDGATITAA
jgi:hypothetical protein